jgi:hypothetical protein
MPIPTYWTENINAFSTLVIALFTVLLFIAVIWQTRTTRSLERAWVIGQLDWFEEGRALKIVTHDSSQTGESTSVTVKLTCKNCGRSVARVDEILGRLDLAEKAIQGRPKESSLTNLRKMDDIPSDSEGHIGLFMSCAGRMKQEHCIFVYVLVKYRDIFGKHRTTSLGYVIDNGFNIYRQEALPARNINT